MQQTRELIHQADDLMTEENARTLAKGLGWFSIGLGLFELLAPGRLDRMLGAGDHRKLTRFYGLREIGAGAGILASEDPTPWVWARVAGDVADLASLGPTLDERNPHRGFALMAFGNVALITALDIACAVALSRRR